MINTADHLADLRTVTTFNHGDLIYVKGHTAPGDGGGGFFYYNVNLNEPDNDGVIIRPNSLGTGVSGAWLRQIDGYVNVRYFGAFGFATNETVQIQRAIDYAADSAKNIFIADGSTVFIPNGNYVIDQLTMRSGVRLIGDAPDQCILTADANSSNPYMIVMESGPVVSIEISNLKLTSNHNSKGCIHFQAAFDSAGNHGGLWLSTFKNLFISNFQGHGIYLEGGAGESNFRLPNQFLTFENVRVVRETDFTHALYMTGQQGQITFLNCTFDGKTNKGQNVRMSGSDLHISAVVSFINCTMQDAEYGILMDYAQNITIDNCWFENLDIAVTADGSEHPCKGITVMGSRFANASGFGSLDVPNTNPPGTGRCIDSINSEVSVMNNFVLVTDASALEPWNAHERFILANPGNRGVNTFANSFAAPHLGYSHGVMQVVNVQNGANGGFIDARNNPLVFVNGSGTLIQEIHSDVNAGEQVVVRANGTITFDNSGNINLVYRPTLKLIDGEVATFTKVDGTIGTSYREYWQLSSLITDNTP